MLLRTRQPLLVFLRQQSPPALLAHCRTPPLPPPPTPLPLFQRILTCCPPPLHNAMSTSPPPAPTATHTNRLADERSPYLLQHAHNPVDWYPWGQEAFSRAVAEDKLIFLSIGYSTCHWCHVMEKESFENVAIADILRKDYIAIKLDREERPDIDKVYQNFVAKTTGLAGWPLTVVLTPTREPIIGGTYFPPEDKFGHMGLKTYVEAIAKQWKAKRALLSQEAKSSLAKLQTDITKHLNSESPMPDEMALTTCFQQMHSRYKRDHGGFSDKPKFPQESMMNFLLALQERRGAHTAEGGGALEMVAHTLLRMGYGGIHDHVAAGFARYSVDERWHVPHFEKMLYDQAQLGVLYVDAHVAVGDEPLFGALAEDILLYVRRELTHALGGFYGAQDADSLPSADAAHKKEGAFCVWEMGELQALLTDAKDLELFCYHFGAKSEGNVNPRMDPHNELKHKNVLCCFGTYEETAKKFGLSVEQTKENLRKSLEILRIARLQRPKPSTDTKIITAWNGLMLAAYARTGFAFKKQVHIDIAIKAANFIKQWLTASDGSLLRCCYGVEDNIEQVDVPIPGLLVDYAYLIRGLLHLYTATLDGSWLAWAEQLQDIQNTKFWDPKDGSYFQIQEGDEFAIMRDKDDYDGAEPSGTSVAVHNLIHLEHYLERKDYREKAEQIFKSYSTLLRYSPISLPEMTAALIQFNHSPHQIFIAGERGAPDTEALIDVVRKEFMCGAVLVIADGAEGKSSLLYQRHKSLENIHALHGKATAYMCREFACSLPVTDPEDLRVLLRDRHKRRAE